jgi:hypothetical protein
MKRFLTIVSLLTVVATPAFARSFGADNGTANGQSFVAIPTALQNDRITARESGIRAYAMVSRARSAHVTPHEEGSAYNGNWDYTPGDGVGDAWRRSHGFWDTNAPGCPFKSC